jgi:hypothetical protein
MLTIRCPGHRSRTVSVARHWSLSGWVTGPQRTSSFPGFSPSFGLLCSSLSYTTSSATLSYPVNGTVLGVLKLGTVVLARDSVAGLVGSVVDINLIAHPHHPRHTQRMDLPRPGLKDKLVAPAFGQVSLPEV